MKTFPLEILKAIEAYALKYLRYEPDTGRVVFKIASRMNKIKAGEEAGMPGPYGYLRLCLFLRGKKYDVKVHRLAWLLHYGEWPAMVVDHIDHCRTNNRISNLRTVPNGENIRNSGVAQNNTSGYTGVTWNRLAGKWQAQYMKDKKMNYIGVFACKEEANSAVVSARLADGFHANHGEGSSGS